jgi:hypothetical protein
MTGKQERGQDKMAEKSQMWGEEMVLNQIGGKTKVGRIRRTKSRRQTRNGE